MSADATRASEILASGLLDRYWVAAQRGAPIAGDVEALECCLDTATDCSPHPLYDDAWCGQSLASYLTDHTARQTVSPHPLVDLARITAEHPESSRHPHGPLSWWVRQAGEDTPVPVPSGFPEVTWGRLRAAALRVAAQRLESSDVRSVQRCTRQPPSPSPEPPALPPASAVPLVTVVLAVRDDSTRLRAAVDAVRSQTYDGWELVVVDNGSEDDTPAVLARLAADEPRVVSLTMPRGVSARAANAALDRARGRYVAFIDTRHAWAPDFLRIVVGHLEAEGAPMAHAAMRLVRSDGEWFQGAGGTRAHLLAHDHVDLACLVVQRELVTEVEGFDESLGGGEAFDLMLRLAELAPLRLVPRVLVERTDDTDDDPRWTSTVLERHLVDWPAACHRPREAGRLSIVLPVTDNLERTMRWVTRAMAHRTHADVELVVVGSRLQRPVETALAMLLAAYPGARLLTTQSRIGPALGANLGISDTTGEVVALARTTVKPPPTAFRALAAAFADPEVVVAQPLVVDRSGLVVSAGAVFGPGLLHPEPFLAGHASSDAHALSSREVPAPLSPVVAVRAAELLRLRGLDMRVGDTMPEVDLGLRVAADGLGTTVVVPEETVVLKARQPPRTDRASEDLRALRERWPSAPPGGEDAWASAGFEVVGRRREAGLDPPGTAPGRLEAHPLTSLAIVRPLRAVVGEGPPALRWALDIAAPSGRRGQRWGDSSFARSLADALERLGQRVAVDTRDLRHRASRELDDVVLVLRGLDRVVPRPGRVNLMWVISHPDLVDREELAAYDRVYGASATWATRVTSAMGLEVRPLLQCTDPQLFNPSRGEPDTGAPVLFVGNSRDVYRSSVRSALGAGAVVELHGSDWQRFVDPHLIASTFVPNDELGELYCRAGVVLNDHHDDMRREGFLANRLFDVTACAARLVTDEIAGLTEVFGDVVRTFRDETEMRPLLADPDHAFPPREVRLALAERVGREHSFDHRAKILLDDAVRLLPR